MEDQEAIVAAFMEATGCGPEDAFDRLASCGGHLGNAINSFFSMDAGPSSGPASRRSRSPPPSPRQVSVSDSSSSSEEDAVPARPVVVPGRRPRVSRWDSETKVVVGKSKSSRRRERRRRNRRGGRIADTPAAGGARAADADANRGRRRRFREFRQDIVSDGEDDVEEQGNNSCRRRRLNPADELTSEGEKNKAAAGDNSRHQFREDAITVSSSSSSDDDDDDNNMLEELEEPAPPQRNRTFEDLFKVPHGLTFKGTFHAAKAHAARRQRWLLANVQNFETLPLPSLHQNRDVWGNALVDRCVRDRFVLWQRDAGAGDDGEEARKVLGYYGIPHGELPVVVVVDPVTGQAMDVLLGSAACEFNDSMVRLGPFTVTTPTIPVMVAKKPTASASAGAQSNTRPATRSTTTTSTAPMTTTVMRKQPDAVVPAVAAVAPQARQEQAPTTTTVAEPVMVAACTGQQQPAPESPVEEKVCKVRVRLADGRAVMKEFGSQCAVAALFAYCRSTLAAPEKPFRLLRFVGRATEEIGDQNASFESLGLHLTTVSVHLG